MGDAQNELGLLPKFNDLCEIAVSDILSDQYSAHCRETQRIKIDVTNFLIQFCCVSCCLEALTFNTQKNHKESSQPSEIFQNEMVKRAFEFDNTKKRYKIDISNLIEPELSKFHTNKENIPRIFSKHRFWQTMNPLEHLWSVNTIQKLTSFLEENISADAISAIFENTHLSHTKGEATQGVYYTPTAEIKSTILFACYYYLIKKIQDHNNDVFKLLFRILYDIDAPHSITAQERNLYENIYRILSQSTVLDPSCGSGSFLLEYWKFLNKIQVKLGFIQKGAEFERIIQIYGVDIDEWAILLTEFRFYMEFLNFKVERQAILEDQKISILTSLVQNPLFHSQLIKADFVLENENIQKKFPKFDIILGNPPFIRNRDISDPKRNNHKDNLRYREDIKKILSNSQKIPIKSQRIDYYLYFFYLSLQYLNSNGILGFITSNSWMNVTYGYEFQKYLCENEQIRAFIESDHKSFGNADINTVISIIQKPLNRPILTQTINFLQLKKPFSSIAARIYEKISLLSEFHQLKDISTKISITEENTFRLLVCSQKSIYEFNMNGNQSENNSYEGYNWRNYYFVAPDFFFQLRAQFGHKVVFLKELAEIKRGITTNCNEYFGLKKIAENCYQNGFGNSFFLEPEVVSEFIMSPRQLDYPLMEFNKIGTYMFFTNQDMNNLLTKKYKNAIKYVEYGESVPIILKKGATKGRMIKGVVNLASFKQKYEKGNHPWYCLKPKKEEKKLQKKIIIQKIYDDTYKIALIEKPILVNNTFYELVLKPEFQGQETIIISLLFFALTVLSLELHGRTNFGGGALDTSVTDIENIMILNPKNLSKEMLQEIQQKATPLFHQKFAPFEKMIKSPERFVFDQYLVNILGLKISVDELYQKLQSIIIKRKRKRKEEKSA